ncbi:MAG: hypothetical protein ACQETH_07710 [Candidatus Rifleibacteriota bacterium]
MAVTEVIARLYDSGMQKLEKKAEAADKEFSEVLNELKKSEQSEDQCKTCTEDVEKAEGGEANDAIETSGNEEVASAAGFRFSIFIRTSSSIQSYGDDMMNRFIDATRDFTKALYQQDTQKIDGLDSYLGQAQQAATSGQQQTLDFVDQILSAADNGLKAATNSINAAGMMSGFNLSMNSAMPGTSSADIAGVYLQDAFKNGFPTNNPTTTAKSSDLKIIKQQTDYDETAELQKISNSNEPGENQILDKFLEMLDEMTSNFEKPASAISEYSFKFAYSSLFQSNASGVEQEEAVVDSVQDKGTDASESNETLKA